MANDFLLALLVVSSLFLVFGLNVAGTLDRVFRFLVGGGWVIVLAVLLVLRVIFKDEGVK